MDLKIKRMKKKYIWWGITAVIVVAGIIFLFGRKKIAAAELFVNAEQGDFEITVNVTGELVAKNYERIYGPDMRSGLFRVTDIRIQDMVPEGTLVEQGDYIAELDRSSARNSMLDVDDRIEQSLNRVVTMEMDTAVSLKGLRDNLINMGLAVEEAKMVLAESVFEPPATIRKAEINLDKVERALEQEKANYKLKQYQMKVNMMDAQSRLDRYRRQKEDMTTILEGFTIRAPMKGMVIYYRERGGQKRKTGSLVNAWDNVVATLPDLSIMLSRTYVNEIDISKIRRGQEVRIGIDAFPEKKLTGEVISVADIGEQLANTDAKVFEVIIEVNESDTIMRPSMTTSNSIVVNTLSNVTYIPIDALFSQDSIPFVYTANKIKQVVVLGESNDNEVIVEQGLSPGDKIYLSVPENTATWKMAGEELIPIIKTRELEKKKEREARERQIQEDKRRPKGRLRNGNVFDESSRGSQSSGTEFRTPGGPGSPQVLDSRSQGGDRSRSGDQSQGGDRSRSSEGGGGSRGGRSR